MKIRNGKINDFFLEFYNLRLQFFFLGETGLKV